jgi:hypothetical protein
MTSHDLKQLLEAHAGDVEDRDFADTAWAAAVGRRRNRRLAMGGGVAAALALVTAIVTVPALRGADTTPATPTPSVTTSVSGADVAFYGRDGTPYLRGGDQASLRSAEAVTKIPPQDLRIPAAPPSLASVIARPGGAQDLVVIAVGSQRVSGKDRPLLFVTSTSVEMTWAAVDLLLGPIDQVNGGSALQPGAISPDGHTIVFVQPRELVVLDARTASVRRVPLADPNVDNVRLEGGGFADDGSYVTWGSGAAFVLAKGANALTRAANEARPGTWTIESDLSGGESLAVLVRRGADHIKVGARSVETHLENYGPSAAGAGWVVQGGFPDNHYLPAGEARSSGLLAVRQDGTQRKVLVMDERKDGPVKGGLTAVAFLDGTPHPTVVFRYQSTRADSLGAWDLVTDKVSFVSRLDDPTTEPDRARVVAVSTRTSWTS